MNGETVKATMPIRLIARAAGIAERQLHPLPQHRPDASPAVKAVLGREPHEHQRDDDGPELGGGQGEGERVRTEGEGEAGEQRTDDVPEVVLRRSQRDRRQQVLLPDKVGSIAW